MSPERTTGLESCPTNRGSQRDGSIEIGSDRCDRRRAGRPCLGLHAGSAGLRGRALREERLAGREGRGAVGGWLPVRHGADHPADAVGPPADLRRGRPRPEGRAGADPARSRSGGPSSRTARRPRPARRFDADDRRRSMRSLPGARPAGAIASSSTSPSGSTTSPSAISSGGRSARSATCSIRPPR